MTGFPAEVVAAAFDAAAVPASYLRIHERVMTGRSGPKPTMPQRRFLSAVAALAKAGPVRLGDALTGAGEPTIQCRTVNACQRYGWVVRHGGEPPTWELTETGRAEVAS